MSLSAQETIEKTTMALSVLSSAIERDQKNPQLRFQKAHILMTLDQYDEALVELQEVEVLAPQEPPVHALLGQIYARRGDNKAAMKHITVAMTLDPKEANALKAIMEGLEEVPQVF
ncbi:tetratricopeptide repeat protein [archaeon]|nr:MAG: tetratricopeptide repeat protein [archaeon]